MDRLYSRREILGIIGTEIAALGLASCSPNVQETAKEITNTSTARPTETKTATPIPATSTVTLIPFKFPTPAPTSTETKAPTKTPTPDPEKERADMFAEMKEKTKKFIDGEFKDYLDPNQKGFFVDRYTKVPYPISYSSIGKPLVKDVDFKDLITTPVLLGVFKDEENLYITCGSVTKSNTPFAYVLTTGFYGTKYPDLNKAILNERHVDSPTWPLPGSNSYTSMKIEWLEKVLPDAVGHQIVAESIGFDYIVKKPGYTGIVTKDEWDTAMEYSSLENASPIINAYKGIKTKYPTVFWDDKNIDDLKLEDLKKKTLISGQLSINFPFPPKN